MAKINDKYSAYFDPTFKAIIGGNAVQLTRQEMERHPEKYINTNVAYLYENVEALRGHIKKGKKPKVTALLDMKTQTKGATFNKAARKAAFDRHVQQREKRQERLRKKLSAKAPAKKAATKQSKSTKDIDKDAVKKATSK